MPDCELLFTCPFFNDKTKDMSEMAETFKEQYRKGDYAWCGRYMAFKVLERELKIVKSTVALVSRSKGDHYRKTIKLLYMLIRYYPIKKGLPK